MKMVLLGTLNQKLEKSVIEFKKYSILEAIPSGIKKEHKP